MPFKSASAERGILVRIYGVIPYLVQKIKYDILVELELIGVNEYALRPYLWIGGIVFTRLEFYTEILVALAVVVPFFKGLGFLLEVCKIEVSFDEGKAYALLLLTVLDVVHFSSVSPYYHFKRSLVFV